MADHRDRSGSSGSTLLVSAIAGAVAGAAGLAWWLLSESERRRQAERQRRILRLSRLQSGAQDFEANGRTRPRLNTDRAEPVSEAHLHDRVQQLNQAIEDVRRQLEQLQTQP